MKDGHKNLLLFKHPGKYRFCLILIFSILLSSCLSRQHVSQPDQNNLYQSSVLSSLLVGNFDGETTMAMLKNHGDFGLGTFNALDGEMVVLDGIVYQVREDGQVYLPGNETKTPFSVVTFFTPQETMSMKDDLSCTDLHAILDVLYPESDVPYAIRITGDFANMQVRAPFRQDLPYRTLKEALNNQAVFNLKDIGGTMVGFRLPEFMSGLNATGYHFHFISADFHQGGHVLTCQSTGVTVEVDVLESLHVDMPDRSPIH